MPKERVERDEEDLVRLYLTDIGQYPLLTKDDEVRLAKAIEAGKEAGGALEKGGKEVTISGMHLAILSRGPDGAWKVKREVSSLDHE